MPEEIYLESFFNLQLIEGAQISTMAELAEWTVDSNKILTF